MLDNLLTLAGRIRPSTKSVFRGATDSLTFKQTKGKCVGKILKTL